MEEGGNSIRAGATTPTIFDLPFEDIVLTHIVKYLDTSDLLNLRCCSRTFQGFVEKIYGEKKSLIIKCVSTRSDNAMNSMDFCMAVQNCQRLRVIRLENFPNISKEKLAALITNNPRIKEFTITFKNGCIFHVDGLQPLTQCKDLIHLEIKRAKLQNSFLMAFVANNILLQRINFTAVFGFTGRVLAAFFAKQYNLLKITLHTLLVFLQPSLIAIGGSCQQLEEIDVRGCKQVTDMGIMSIAQKCPKIRTILFTSSKNRTDPNLPTMPLAIHLCARLSRDTLNYLESRNITTHKNFTPFPRMDDSSDSDDDSLTESDMSPILWDPDDDSDNEFSDDEMYDYPIMGRLAPRDYYSNRCVVQ